MLEIGKEEQLFKYRILYNGYPIVNEFSQGAFPLLFPSIVFTVPSPLS